MKQAITHRYFLIIPTVILSLLLAMGAAAQQDPNAPRDLSDVTINTLHSLLVLQAGLKRDIVAQRQELAEAQTETEKQDLQRKLTKLEQDLKTTTQNLRGIAAGADIASLRVQEEKKFSLQEELFSLLKPALKEMKDMTSRVREKSELKDRVAYYLQKEPVAQLAVENITGLLATNEDEDLDRYLEDMLAEWSKQLVFIKSERRTAELKLEKLEQSETSLAAASQSYLKSFFQKRGLYLTQALLTVFAILLLSRISHGVIERVVPGYRKEHRSFRIRLLDLFHRSITMLLVVLAPMVVFYLVEDWMLFSLGILFLFGIALTLRKALPRYWAQIQLFLNIGSVREGERIDLDGLPWRVRRINLFSELENPTSGLSQRVRINDLVDLKSRPYKSGDPWFPCMKDDWVLLGDGTRGKVTGISQELIEMVQRGGARRTYLTENFLSLSPINLTRNFRLKETISITYSLQRESVADIPDILKEHIERRLEDEGYADSLNRLRVEFEKANTSSLDIVVIADFDGQVADLYGRLGRAMQRWCVEACTQNNWEIPFTQVSLHTADSAS